MMADIAVAAIDLEDTSSAQKNIRIRQRNFIAFSARLTHRVSQTVPTQGGRYWGRQCLEMLYEL